MHYVIQENIFREQNYDNLIIALERLKLSYEIIKLVPFIDTIEFKSKRKDVFPFGAVKLARISKQYNWKPGSQLNENHNFFVYRNYYKENLLNYNSKIIKMYDNFFSKKPFFVRPITDAKDFTGKTFDMLEWEEFKKYFLINNPNKNIEIQIAPIRKIQKEIRFWIVNGKVITASQYKLGSLVCYNNLVDNDATLFCEKMLKLFQLNDAFVMDICLVDNEYKIVECGCINAAGFYKADLQKLLISLENHFNFIKSAPKQRR